jgi:hypothetical protein
VYLDVEQLDVVVAHLDADVDDQVPGDVVGVGDLFSLFSVAASNILAWRLGLVVRVHKAAGADDSQITATADICPRATRCHRSGDQRQV